MDPDVVFNLRIIYLFRKTKINIQRLSRTCSMRNHRLKMTWFTRQLCLQVPCLTSRKVDHLLILLLFNCIIPNNCVDVVPQRENYEPDYSVYHNVSHLIKELRELEYRYKSYIRISDEYMSRNGVTQLFTRVSNFSAKDETGPPRTNILLSFGEHAREFFPVESLLYFLKNVTKGTEYSKEKGRKYQSFSFSSWVLSNFDFYIVAMTNPDGRHFIESSKNYCWRGTANGIDLNRNFDWNYGKEGSSSDPKDDEYRGAHAFSEPETHIFKDIISDTSFDAFISFHSGVRHIYIPFADSHSQVFHNVPYNEDKMKELAQLMASSTPLRPFKHGTAHKLAGYYADGTSFDYMSGVAKIPFSFAIELWQHARHVGRSCFDEFNPHSNNLQIELSLVHPLYVAFLSYLYHWKRSGGKKKPLRIFQPRPLKRLRKDESSYKVSQDSQIKGVEPDDESSLQGQMMFLIFTLLILIFAYIGIKHVMHLVRKKRVISLRSLSSTFALFRS